MNKQIEELAKGIFEHCNTGLFEDEARDIARFVIAGQGYRKASEVTLEVISEIEQNFEIGYGGVFEFRKLLADLKKKYSEVR